MSDQRWRITKAHRRWVVDVPAGAVAVVSFTAPFGSFDAAVAYVRYWLGRT